MESHNKFQETALIILRLVIGAIFIVAGVAKFSFWSEVPGGFSGAMVNLMKFLSIVEPLGGVALIVGFLTRWAAAGLGIIMIGAIFVLQFGMDINFSTPTGPGWDFPLMVLAGCLVLMAFGAGRLAVDARRQKIMSGQSNN